MSRAISEVRPEVRLNVLVHTHHAEKFNQLLNEVSGDARLSLIQVSSLNPATAIMLQQRLEQAVKAGKMTQEEADEKLKAVFGGKKQVSMFEMTKLVNNHLK